MITVIESFSQECANQQAMSANRGGQEKSGEFSSGSSGRQFQALLELIGAIGYTCFACDVRAYVAIIADLLATNKPGKIGLGSGNLSHQDRAPCR